MDVIPAVDVEL